VSSRVAVCIGLVAVATATLVVGLVVWRPADLATGERVLGTVLLSAWILWPVGLQLDGLRSRRFADDVRARTAAIVVGCSAAGGWTVLVDAVRWPSASAGHAVAPAVVLAASVLAHRAARGPRLSPAPPPAGW
jgi:hypothetical protein